MPTCSSANIVSLAVCIRRPNWTTIPLPVGPAAIRSTTPDFPRRASGWAAHRRAADGTRGADPGLRSAPAPAAGRGQDDHPAAWSAGARSGRGSCRRPSGRSAPPTPRSAPRPPWRWCQAARSPPPTCCRQNQRGANALLGHRRRSAPPAAWSASLRPAIMVCRCEHALGPASAHRARPSFTELRRLVTHFLGAAVAAVLVHAIASLGRDGATPMKLAIAGAALTAGLASWTTGVLLADRKTMESLPVLAGRHGRRPRLRRPAHRAAVPGHRRGARAHRRPAAQHPRPRRRPGPRARAVGRRRDRLRARRSRSCCSPAPPPRWPGRSPSSGWSSRTSSAPRGRLRLPPGPAVLACSCGAAARRARRHRRPRRAAAGRGAGRHHDRRRRRAGLPRADPPRAGGRCDRDARLAR